MPRVQAPPKKAKAGRGRRTPSPASREGRPFTSRIVNNTADPIRRGNVVIRAGYDLDLETALPILRAATADAPGVIERSVNVRLEDLGADDLLLNLSFWSDFRRSDFQDTCSAVRTHLLRAMPGAGISFPEPDLRRLAPADLSR